MNNKQLELIEIPIKQNQYLTDIYNIHFGRLPSRVILNKLLPGTGATTAELESDFFLIMIEPYRPVIEGKLKKYKNILGVYKGIYEDKITEYIDKQKGKPLKFLVTPESYKRLVKVLKTRFNVYKDFRIVIDECDRLISDVDFRKSITIPMEDFFRYDSSIFISATPILPSDNRFAGNDFKLLKLKPDYDYRKKIELISTNSVVSSLRAKLKPDSEVPYFIFINSTNAISALITALNLKSQSRIYCSEESVRKLRGEGYTNADSELGKFSAFNFLTSRFFPAVDIDLEYKPNVIMLSELFFAEHSMLDPFTDSIQITGRFRAGVNSITHITNTNSRLKHMSKAEVTAHIRGGYEVYKQLSSLYHSVSNEGAREVFKQALERVDFARFFILDDQLEKKLNYFMVDNLINDEKVKSYYTSPDALKSAYEETNHFIVSLSSEFYTIGDEDKLRKHKAYQSNQKEYFKETAVQLVKLLSPPKIGVYHLININKEIDEIKKSCPLIYEAYNLIGLEALEAVDYNVSAIKKAMKEKRKSLKINNFAMIDDIYEVFSTGKPYQDSFIVNNFTRIYKDHGLDHIAKASHIKRYYKADRTTVKGAKGYNVHKKLFLSSNEI